MSAATIRFTKMHGIGNDFVCIDAVSQRVHLQTRDIRRMADRHLGIGCDQVLVAEPPDRPDVDFRYRIYNPDGSEAEQCGNGARCFARFVRHRQLTTRSHIRVQTLGGILELHVIDRHKVKVNMGEPGLQPAMIPLRREQQALDYPLELDGRPLRVGAVSMGNPHAVLRVEEDLQQFPVEHLGPLLQCHPDFPQRCNAGFMQVLDECTIRLRVYERGAGETQACGSGACAAVVYSRLQRWVDSEVTVQLPGGKLVIHWQGEGHPVWLTGPTAIAFEGSIRL